MDCRSSPLKSALPLLAAAALLSAAAPAEAPGYTAFARENDAAMSRMMSGMEVKPTGDVDTDFVAMMIPHHQGAIDMSRAVLRYGRDPRLKTLARGIISKQEQEIAQMRALLGGRVPTAIPGGDHRHMMMH